MKNYIRLFLSFFLTFASPMSALFVGPPSSSAGIIERELEKEYEAQEVPPERTVPLLEVDIPEEQFDVPDGKKIQIDRIQFQGNDVFSTSTLHREIQYYIGKQLSMCEIRHICETIEAKYLAKGYFLARAYLPMQVVESQTLKIEIIEGMMGQIQVEGNCYYKSGFIRSYFLDLQNKTINYHEVMRALLLLNEFQDLSVALIFKKGRERGKADVILRAKDSLPIHLYWDYNNYGSKITTDSRTGARFDWGNLLINGDLFTAAEVVGFPPANLTFTDLIYNIPINSRGTKMEFSYLFSYFKVGELRELGLKGNAHVAEMKLTHALIRKKQYDMNLFGTFDYKNLSNFALNETASADRLRIFGAGIFLDYSDSLKGRNVGSARVYIGAPNFLGGSKAVDPKCSREGAGGRFTHFNLDMKRIQQLGGNWYLLLNFQGQVSFYKLPLAEQMYIGGFDTVRGYALASALGDHGYCINAEFRAPIPGISDIKVPKMNRTWKEFIQLVAVFDHGQVYLNGGGEDQSRRIALTGAGPGIRIFAPYRVNFTFDVGFPITATEKTSNPFYYFKVSIDFL